MLNHIRLSIERDLSATPRAVLSTCGPAGLQAGLYACEAAGVCLYLFVPATADLCQNLEEPAPVVVTAEGWQVHGEARALPPGQMPAGLDLLNRPDRHWSRLVEVRIRRYDKMHPQGWGAVESMDLDSEYGGTNDHHH